MIVVTGFAVLDDGAFHISGRSDVSMVDAGGDDAHRRQDDSDTSLISPRVPRLVTIMQRDGKNFMNTRPSYSHALQSIVSPSSRSVPSTFFWYISDWSDITARDSFLSDAGSCRRRRQIFATRGWIVSRWPLRCRRSLLHPRRAVTVHGGDLTNRRRPLSVDPRNRDPLGCRVHALDCGL